MPDDPPAAVQRLPDETSAPLAVRLEDSSKHARNWRRLEIFAEPFFGLGFLALGAAVAMLDMAGDESDLGFKLLFVVTGLFLAWWGSALVKAPIAVKSYFAKNEDRMEAFLDRWGAAWQVVGREELLGREVEVVQLITEDGNSRLWVDREHAFVLRFRAEDAGESVALIEVEVVDQGLTRHVEPGQRHTGVVVGCGSRVRSRAGRPRTGDHEPDQGKRGIL